MRYPMNQLPSVKFMAKQVYSPLVHLDTGALDISKLFAVEDSDYSDQNYINGCLVNCFEGFCKQLLSKIWCIFHDPTLVKRFYEYPAKDLANPFAV